MRNPRVEDGQYDSPQMEDNNELHESQVFEVMADNMQPEYLDRTMKKKYRWLMLILCCVFVIGNYFCYDNPAAVESQLEKVLKISTSEYGLLYTVYAIPNCILPLIGGVILDKIGIRNGLLIFTIILCIGQGIFMYGRYK